MPLLYFPPTHEQYQGAENYFGKCTKAQTEVNIIRAKSLCFNVLNIKGGISEAVFV